MNKHKAYWSQMHDANTEPSVKSLHFNELEVKLRTLLNMYDKTEVLSLVRNVYQEVTDAE